MFEKYTKAASLCAAILLSAGAANADIFNPGSGGEGWSIFGPVNGSGWSIFGPVHGSGWGVNNANQAGLPGGEGWSIFGPVHGGGWTIMNPMHGASINPYPSWSIFGPVYGGGWNMGHGVPVMMPPMPPRPQQPALVAIHCSFAGDLMLLAKSVDNCEAAGGEVHEAVKAAASAGEGASN